MEWRYSGSEVNGGVLALRFDGGILVLKWNGCILVIREMAV